MTGEKRHFVTCGQMKILEKRADSAGLSYRQMMENAGRAAAEAIMEKEAYSFPAGGETGIPSSMVAEESFGNTRHEDTSSNNDRSAVIFCGKGNNGGDGFVCGRILRKAGWKVTVVLVDGKPVTEDSRENFRLLCETGARILDMKENDRALKELNFDPDIIVDAIYGTGFHGSLSGAALKAAIYINTYSASAGKRKAGGKTLVFALDIPSGLGGDVTSEKYIDVNSVKAHFTVTFHARKPVHLQKFAPLYCGETIVADIGIEEDKLWDPDTYRSMMKKTDKKPE